MRFSSISINLLEIFRIISFVFDLKYLSQNSINFNMLGVFWNPQDKQISKLSLDLYLEQHLKEILILRFYTAAGAVCHHCIIFFFISSSRLISNTEFCLNKLTFISLLPDFCIIIQDRKRVKPNCKYLPL